MHGIKLHALDQSLKMIKTFIFFDLETTGLIERKVMPKIIELSLIAVSRNAICETMDPLPRVLHKLVLPVHPNTDISKLIHNLTGLSNKNLEEVQYFNYEACNLVMNFINRQTPPTCFVAYNGNNFDYPIFLSELKNINKDVSGDVLSIDMLNLIKDFFSLKENAIENRNDIQTTSSMSNKEDIKSLLNDGYDKALCDALDSVMNSSFKKYNKNNHENKESNSSAANILNTPKTSCYKKIQKMNEKTPENQVIKSQDMDKCLHKRKESIARRKLHFTSGQPVNFKLSSVCKHIFGTDPQNAHTAEGDCLSMIRCAIQLGNYFVEWADCKATPLINYDKEKE
ncbi:uncharacterized protein LOC117609325 isoform X1 [Osmia lignaria lignaria]|uniref:uncharacterized protein LOC117609325 isoform X1 n=3 Tax=Osmia lignaria lignaria TaxID=1437193 RepID=UPI0014796ACE|nr:uncharacterized protein LOC117609325 isoform X1 [Osmia lignaria]